MSRPRLRGTSTAFCSCRQRSAPPRRISAPRHAGDRAVHKTATDHLVARRPTPPFCRLRRAANCVGDLVSLLDRVGRVSAPILLGPMGEPVSELCSRATISAAAERLDDPRRPERGALLRSAAARCESASPLRTPRPACCRPTRSGPIPLCMNLDLVVENGSQLGIP